MSRIAIWCAVGLVAIATSSVEAAPRQSRPFTMAWIGVGVGMVNGHVELPCTNSQSGRRNCGESGVFPSYHVDLTVAGPVGFRLRGVRAEEATRYRPRELATMVGFKLARKWYGYIGHSSIFHADNEYDGVARGFGWEFVRAHRARDSFASQTSIMGHISSDVTFIGVSIGFRAGDLR